MTPFLGNTHRRKFVAHKIWYKFVPYEISEKSRFIGENCSYHNLGSENGPNCDNCDFFQQNGVSQKFGKGQFCRKFYGLQIVFYELFPETSLSWRKAQFTLGYPIKKIFFSVSQKSTIFTTISIEFNWFLRNTPQTIEQNPT
jgi:hypothetical protein